MVNLKKPTFQTKTCPFFLIYLTFIQLCNKSVSIILEDNARIVTEERGVNDVIDAINTHAGCPELIEAAAAVFLSLSIEGKSILETFVEYGVLFLLIVDRKNK